MGIKSWIKRLDQRIFRSPGAADATLRAVTLSRFLDWCRDHPGPVVERRLDVHAAALAAVGAAAPVDYFEFGVFRGETLRWWVEHNGHPDSRFVGFDSFRGLPEDWTDEHRQGAFDTGGHTPDIDDPRCSFEIGWFQKTLPGFVQRLERKRPWVLHLDADLFSSTLLVLGQLAPHLADGDVLVFDEFHDYMDEFRAFEAIQAACPLTCETLAATPGYDGFGYAQLAVRVRPAATREGA